MEFIQTLSSSGDEGSCNDNEDEVESLLPKPAFDVGAKVRATLMGENPRIVDATIIKIGTKRHFFNNGRYQVEYKNGVAATIQ